MTPAGAAGALLLLFGLVWLALLRRTFPVRTVVVVALLARAALMVADVHSDDVYRYVWEGRVQAAGFNPYERAPDDSALASLRDSGHARINHPSLTTVYPPLAQGCFRVAVALGLREAGFARAMLVLDMALVLLLAAWLRSSSVLNYAWSPLALVTAATGHVDVVMLLCLAGAAWAWDRRRARIAAVLLGGAILAKTVAVLLLPWLALRRPRAALLALLVVFLGYLPFGFHTGSLSVFATRFTFNASLFHLLGFLGVPLLVLWVVGVAYWQPRLPHAVALTFAGLLLVSPTVHFWYLTWILVGLSAVEPACRWRKPLLLWCATIALTARTYLDTPPWIEHYAWTWAEYAAPTLLALALFLRRKRAAAPAPRSPVAPEGPLPDFGVVIPARGEAKNLSALLPRWRSATHVVVADTPSGDGTEALCRTFPNVTCIAVARPGYGAAVEAGLQALRSKGVPIAIVCDADHATGPEQAAALLAPLRDPVVGLVSAARTTPLPLAQRWGNRLACALIALGWGRRFADLGPFRALRLPFPELADRGFGWNVEMNVRALERGLGVVEVALPAGVREHGRDRISGTLRGVFGAGTGILTQLFRLRERSCS